MSEKECRTDCSVPLRFPRRPGTRFFVAGDEDCFCCEPNEQARVSADNRPALPRFNYRIGTYAGIREWLLHRINHASNLQNWTYREPDDPAIALLEGAAILGDILTFYQELYANEAFLRTASWRESIADLVRLLGYRLSPALGGRATFAFEIKKDEPVIIPAGFPVKATLEELENPTDFETKEEITAYPWLSRFNLFRPLIQQDISSSTTEFYITAPEQSVTPIEINAGDRLMIGEPDKLMPEKLTNGEIVIVDSIRQLHGTKIFKIKGQLKRGGNVDSLAAFRLGRVFHHFGHNGPNTITEISNSLTGGIHGIIFNAAGHPLPGVRVNVTNLDTGNVVVTALTSADGSFRVINLQTGIYRVQVFAGNSSVFKKDVTVQEKKSVSVNTGNLEEGDAVSVEMKNVPFLRNITGDTANPLIKPDLTEYEFPLDAEVRDLPSKIPLIVQGTFLQNTQQPAEFTLVRLINEIKTTSQTWGALTATVSMLKLNSSLETSVGSKNNLNIREALFHEVVSPIFTIKQAKKETTAADGNLLNFYGTVEQVKTLKDRRIMIEKDAKILTVASVLITAGDVSKLPGLYAITVSEKVNYADFPNENPTTTIFGNLADADEGKTLPEAVLGSGDNTQTFQTFKLPKLPLTYHPNIANTPVETPELEIYVNGRLWRRVDSFFGRAADEEIYIVREDAANNSWVQFGDGKTGAKLPTGINNVSAIYRIGTGAFGALKADTKVQAGAKLKNLDKIQMPLAATGGTKPESGENAKAAAPGKIQSLGRLVGLHDFETEAASLPGVALASAAWRLVNNVPSVAVTVLMETGRSGEINSIQETLNGYNSLRGPARFSIKVFPGKRRYVYIVAEYVLEATWRADLVEPEIRKNLGVNFAKLTGEENPNGLFSLRRRRFGKREYASTIEGTIKNTPGVVKARVTALSFLPDSDKPDLIALPTTKILDAIVACDNSHVLSLYDKHLFLKRIM